MPDWKIRVFACLALIPLVFAWSSYGVTAPSKRLLFHPVSQPATPSPTYDPLAIPVLPQIPSDFERGKYLYYFHCMPCHGDLGQGLTDAFRAVWEEHSDCWGRGCHAGRLKDEGFPIPRVVPAVIGAQNVLARFHDLDALTHYLHDTHPPQRPGKLKDQEYETLAVYLWVSNERPLLVDSNPTNVPIISITQSPRDPATPTSARPAPTISVTPIKSTSGEATAPSVKSLMSPIAIILVLLIFLTSGIIYLVWQRKS